jgi:hypothetical protein
MKISDKTLEQLRIIINGDDCDSKTGYRSGPKLVAFFNDFGFNDTYGQNFPSRWAYTDDKLRKINGTSDIDKCIKKAFAVIDYVGRVSYLDSLIANFNEYLMFDKWKVIRENDVITFKKIDQVVVNTNDKIATDITEDEFLKRTFKVDVDSLGLQTDICEIIKSRLKEIEVCVSGNASLAAIILIGSILEGVLLNMANAYPQQFNQSLVAPKNTGTGKVLPFVNWNLNSFIDVAFDIGMLNKDVKKFSHVLREFRNYIHPYQQMSSQFYPDKQTSVICFQVLKAAINQIGAYRNNQG